MKTKLLIIVLLSFTDVVWGQVSIGEDTIQIELDASAESIETIVNQGKYNLTFKGKYKSLVIEKNAVLRDHLSMEESENPSADSTKSQESLKVSELKQPLKFGRNTEYIIKVIPEGENATEKTYKLYSKSNWEWLTTFGVNSILYLNRNKFVSQEAEGVHTVQEISDRKSMDIAPSIMFTFMNTHYDFSFGFTGGLGFDFQNIAAFSGLSVGIGQNFILTGGGAINKQSRPNSDDYIGQGIDSSGTSDNLNDG